MKQRVVDEVRAFSRFYTAVIGLLDRHVLDSAFSLPEARIMYELYHRDGIQAGEIATLLGLDKGYLSRMLDQFARKGLITRKRSAEDGRAQHIYLTAKGREAFEALNKASDKQVKEMLQKVPDEDGDRLVHHMNEIKKIITDYGNTHLPG
jgi:DNA-binding MarR family transcriptional regulator